MDMCKLICNFVAPMQQNLVGSLRGPYGIMKKILVFVCVHACVCVIRNFVLVFIGLFCFEAFHVYMQKIMLCYFVDGCTYDSH